MRLSAVLFGLNGIIARTPETARANATTALSLDVQNGQMCCALLTKFPVPL